MAGKLASRGTPKQTEYAHEFGLHEYVWPIVCGESRAKWKAAAEFVARAAEKQHDHDCSGPMADGKTTYHKPPFVGEHKDRHLHRVSMQMVHVILAGIPAFFTEGKA